MGGGTWNAYRIPVRKALENYLLVRLRAVKDNIKRDLREVVMVGVE